MKWHGGQLEGQPDKQDEEGKPSDILILRVRLDRKLIAQFIQIGRSAETVQITHRKQDDCRGDAPINDIFHRCFR